MDLPDSNLLIYAVDRSSPYHQPARVWLDALTLGKDPFACSEFVLSSFVRISTNPRILAHPLSADQALEVCERLRAHPLAHRVVPDSRHWDVFAHLCRTLQARGNDVPDAYLAALAIVSGTRLASADEGFGRFPGLRWHNPLTAAG